MRTITLNIYKFKELSAPAQGRAIGANRKTEVNNIDWSYPIIEDAQNVAQLKITGFDLPYDITSTFITDPKSSAQNIISELSADSVLYSIAAKFLSELERLERQEDTAKTEADIQHAEETYRIRLNNYYIRTLDQHYDYLTSDEGVEEYLTERDFEFMEDGTRYYDKK